MQQHSQTEQGQRSVNAVCRHGDLLTLTHTHTLQRLERTSEELRAEKRREVRSESGDVRERKREKGRRKREKGRRETEKHLDERVREKEEGDRQSAE